MLFNFFKDSANENLGHRLIVTYGVTWKGACGTLGRNNSAGAKVVSVRINSTTGEWLSKSLIEDFYGLYHSRYAHRAAFVDDGGRAEQEFGDYLVGVQIEPGCKPILTVRFLPGKKNYLLLWTKEDPRAEKMHQTTSTTEKTAKSGKENVTQQYLTFFGITIGVIFGISVILIIICRCIARKTRERREPI